MSESDEEVIAESNRIIRRLEKECSGNLHLLLEKKRIISEQAEEIEQLKAALNQLCDDKKVAIAELKAENKRLILKEGHTVAGALQDRIHDKDKT